MNDYCPYCHLVVTKFDPNRRVQGKDVYHGDCQEKVDRAFLRHEQQYPSPLRARQFGEDLHD